jgi:hypothetical protein
LVSTVYFIPLITNGFCGVNLITYVLNKMTSGGLTFMTGLSVRS